MGEGGGGGQFTDLRGNGGGLARGEQALRTYLAICFSLAVGNVLNTLHRKQDT